MSNKHSVRDMLITLGFQYNYINRAFKVWEKHYGYYYNVEALTEVMVRLHKKDRSKHEKKPSKHRPLAILKNYHLTSTQNQEESKQASMPPFQPYLTWSEVNQLEIGDKLDHRDEVGRFVYAKIVDKNETILKIHYIGWSKKWDVDSDYKNELWRFAKPGSVSQRAAHRFNEYRKGRWIDINPIRRHPGWTLGEIRRIDNKSGQVQVVYEGADGKNYLYWAHFDNYDEIDKVATNIENNDLNAITMAMLTSRYPRNIDEEINNPYNIDDRLYVKDVAHSEWYHATVVYKRNNWIDIGFDDYPAAYNQSVHVFRDIVTVNNMWYNELSFDRLTNEGLINSFYEWMSVKDTFVADTDEALEWMKNQKQPFRISRLSYMLVSGYALSIGFKHDIPFDIQRIIISFSNFMFVLVNGDESGNPWTCNHCGLINAYKSTVCQACFGMKPSVKSTSSYRALDTNLTIRDFAKLLEIEKKLDAVNKDYVYSNYIHMWCRYGVIKHIYPIKTDKMDIKEDDLEYTDYKRWVEIPDDAVLWLMRLDNKLEYDDVLEIGVDVNLGDKWSFNANVNEINDCDNMLIDEWIFSLEIGDIIDVYKCNKYKWQQGLIQYITDTSLYIHYIGFHIVNDEIIDVTNCHNLSRLSKKYSHCLVPRRSRTLKKRKVKKLRFCWRTDLLEYI